MKLLSLLGLVTIISLNSIAQDNPPPIKDSSSYYQRQLGVLRKRMYDSLMKNEEYQALAKQYRSYIHRSDNYGSFALFTQVVAADYTKLNNSITANGFPAIGNTPVIQFGMGYSGKKNKTIVDFNVFSLGIPEKSKKGDEEIKTLFSTAFILDIGIDVVKARNINIYPYAGLSMRSSSIAYSKPAALNPSFTDLSNLIVNRQSVEAYYLKPGFQAGVGFDFTLKNNTAISNAGSILFFKAGINKLFGKEKYKVEGVSYTPGIVYGNWTISAGVKFFGRK